MEPQGLVVRPRVAHVLEGVHGAAVESGPERRGAGADGARLTVGRHRDADDEIALQHWISHKGRGVTRAELVARVAGDGALHVGNGDGALLQIRRRHAGGLGTAPRVRSAR